MCGRYSFAIEDDLILQRFGIRVRTAIYKAQYNCSPTQKLAVISNEEPDTLNFFRWGLIPSWTRLGQGHAVSLPALINARAETLLEKPSFKNSFRNRRCLVPATGFYEWKRGGDGSHLVSAKAKTPYHIGMKTGEPFCFAGLWDQWISADGEIINSFTIITTSPNELVAGIHDRMPVILHQADEKRWITPHPDQSLVQLLQPYPADLMEARLVEKF
jgi:putative SOS response-associated peptidase YedK